MTDTITQPFPFTTGESHIERMHPHIAERLRVLWGFAEGGRYLSKLIVDSRGGRAGFSPEVMSELLTLATLTADIHAPLQKSIPYQGGARAGERMRKPHDPTLQPLSFQLGDKKKPKTQA